MIRIFIGYDKAESVAFHVLSHSIMRRSSKPVSITPVILDQAPLTREWHPKQSNEFSFSRWLVPWMCDFRGKAIFMDCDMLVTSDISRLWDEYSGREHPVQCVKNFHSPKDETKYLDRPQSAYQYKNWSSFMLFDCANVMCRKLTPEYVNEAEGLDLHQFRWISEDSQDNLIGRLPKSWNFLVGVDYPGDRAPDNIHYTTGGPYFSEYRNCDYGDLWWVEYWDMVNVATRGDIPRPAPLERSIYANETFFERYAGVKDGTN